MEKFCEQCHAPGAHQVCSRCKCSHYCGPECQKAAWKAGHKSKCVKAEPRPRTAPPPPPAAAPHVSEEYAAKWRTFQDDASNPARGLVGRLTPTGTYLEDGTEQQRVECYHMDVSDMSLRELKQLLDARGVDYSKCIEKSEIRALATKVNAEFTAADNAYDKPCTGGEEGAIGLDALQQPQMMPCGHRFCSGCVTNMRQHSVGEAQVCPLCRSPVPDAEHMFLEAVRVITERHAVGQAIDFASDARSFAAVLKIDPTHAKAKDKLLQTRQFAAVTATMGWMDRGCLG